MRTRSGFTLIELIIYVGITAIVVVSLTQVMITILETRQNTGRASEVQQNIRFVTDRMINTLVDAKEIRLEESVFGSPNGTLVLTMGSGAVAANPTSFFTSGSGVFIQEGGAEPMRLSSPDIVIERMEFTFVPNAGTRPVLRITLSGVDAGESKGDKEAVSVDTSFVLRQ